MAKAPPSPQIQPPEFPLGLTFDDVLLLPGFTGFGRNDIDITAHLTRNLTLAIPLVSSPMDTVTESKLAIALAEVGGIGIIHRNLSIEKQAHEVAAVKKKGLLVGAAIGASNGYEERAAALVKAGADTIVVDSAHGFTQSIVESIKYLKQTHPQVDIIAGNVATYDGATALIEAGADALRVGMGPGSICTTRIISGMGVPQLTAIFEAVRAAQGTGVPVIADGGIKYSGDMVKALAAGADTVMMGSYFAACLESPGTVVTLPRQMVPPKFQHLLKNGDSEYSFKSYRGMGSMGAMEQGAKVKSEDEFHGKNYGKDRVMVAEGVEALVPIKGTVKEVIEQAVGGIKSGLYYVGASDLQQLREVAQFTRITQASLTESHPHSLVITNSGKNY